MKKPIFFLFLTLLITVFASGCEEFIQNATSSAVEHVPYYNENCVDIAHIKGSDGKVYAKDVPAGAVGEFTVRRPPLDQGDEVILVAVSYEPPPGCEDYGRDDKKIRFRDGEIGTDDWTIRLRPD